MKAKTIETINFTITVIVFVITGAVSAYLSAMFLELLDITPWSFGSIILFLIALIILFPLLLILFGTIFGKHKFFRDKLMSVYNLFMKGLKKN